MRTLRELVGVLGGVLLSVGSLACEGPTEPILGQLSGTFPLVAFKGDTLPVYQFELTNRQGGGGTGCWSVITYGALTLEPETGRFDKEMIATNSCSGDIVGDYSIFGTYEQDNRKLRFVITRVAPPFEIVFDGAILDTSIKVFNRSPFTEGVEVSIYER